MASVNIREAVREDLPTILAIYAEPDIDDGRVLELSEAEALLDRMAAYPDYTLYVGEIEGEIVGSFALLVMERQ